MNTNTQTQSRREAHHKALEALASNGQPGLKLWRKLRLLEDQANAAATAQCNGEAYHGQPYRDEYDWEAYKCEVLASVRSILGRIPVGFFVNGDPRGYTLKIESEAYIPEGMHKDWGGYGILAAEIEED